MSVSRGPSPTERLAELGLVLPPVAAPLAAYVPAVRTGNLVLTSGQLPTVGGELLRTGKVGADVSAEDAKALVRVATLNALAAIDALVGLDSIARIVKVVGFVASAPGFGGQPGVPDTGATTNLDQTLFLKFGVTIRSMIALRAGSLTDRLVKLTDTDKLAEELFLSVYSRLPTSDEKKDVADALKHEPNRTTAIQELVWALIASSEFRFNH